MVGGGTPDTNNPLYWNGDINWFTPAEIGSNTYASKSERRITEEGLEHSSAKLLPAGRTILFTSRASIGLTAILTVDACTNQGFQSLVVSDRTDVFFLFGLCNQIKTQAIRNAAGSTFIEISGKQLARIPLQIPSLDEQRRIGKTVRTMDSLIDAEKRKLNLLKDKKTALLRQIFDQKARFKGYTDPWEQRKLGDILSYEQPYEYIVSSDDYSPVARTPVLTAGKTLILGYTNEADGIKAATKDSPVIIFDDFTASSHIIDYSFKVKSSAMKILSLRDSENDLYCIYYALTRIIRPSASHERQWISKYARATVTVPSKDEQQVIGDFLRKLDRLIAAESRKIDLLELKKKALLQQMFA